jgi:hypothetical protein
MFYFSALLTNLFFYTIFKINVINTLTYVKI